jgi:hypothetical protein
VVDTPLHALTGVWGTGARDVYVIGDTGRLLHTADGGHTRAAHANDVRAIWAARATTSISPVPRGCFTHATAGASWGEKLTPLATPIEALGGDARSLLVIGAGGLVVRE